jgi:hypothetical protein
VVDYDGNGTPEITYDTNGEVVIEVTYTTLIEKINSLSLRQPYKKLLLDTVKKAQQLYDKSLTQIKYKKLEKLALVIVKQQVVLYERFRLITPQQKQELLTIIESLINK